MVMVVDMVGGWYRSADDGGGAWASRWTPKRVGTRSGREAVRVVMLMHVVVLVAARTAAVEGLEAGALLAVEAELGTNVTRTVTP